MFSPLAIDGEIVNWLFRDPDGSVRSALLCWSIALAAFAIFRVPRQVVLACLLIASVTVGFASAVIEAAPARIIVDAAKPAPSAIAYRSPSLRPLASTGNSAAD